MNAVTLVVIIILLIAFGICLVLVRRHYTKLLDVANKRAQKSQQLKSVFIDNISRTLRSPLQVIEGFCNMILDEKDENMQPAQVRESMLNISSHAQELIDFVAQLHEMSKFEGITPSFTFIEVNLSELMASYRREAMNYTKPDVSVRVTSDLSPHCRAILDTNLMHQLMMHLLTNAAAHVTRGDILELIVKPVIDDDEEDGDRPRRPHRRRARIVTVTRPHCRFPVRRRVPAALAPRLVESLRATPTGHSPGPARCRPPGAREVFSPAVIRH